VKYVEECWTWREHVRDASAALINADEAVGELVNTEGRGLHTGYNDDEADDDRMRHGMYWSDIPGRTRRRLDARRR
jgi:hypothetical protein